MTVNKTFNYMPQFLNFDAKTMCTRITDIYKLLIYKNLPYQLMFKQEYENIKITESQKSTLPTYNTTEE